MKKIVQAVFCFVVLVLPLFMSSGDPAFAEENTDALTSPPPQQFVILGVFDPDHEYLIDGESRISIVDDQRLLLIGSTEAYSNVEEIGVDITLQRWTGSEWKDEVTKSFSEYDRRFIDAGFEYNVDAGYYYRVKTTHWVIESGSYEEGSKISGYILVD